MISRHSTTKSSVPSSQSQSWIPIALFIMITALLFLVRAGAVVKFAFPLGALSVALVLYIKYPISYAGFCWWLLFLAPWISRLSDYQNHAFDEQRLILAAPYLAVAVILPDFIRFLPRFRYSKGGLPFSIAFIGVFYSACIGLVNNFNVFKNLLEFLTPILFGYYFYQNRRYYPAYVKNVQRVFGFGTLVMGIYGMVQYVVAPEADIFWMKTLIEKGQYGFGNPEPLGIRVYSTMHSPGPFAIFMMAGLLLSFNGKGMFQIPSAITGYLSFMLSLVRSAWVGWFLGLIMLFSASKPKLQIRLVLTVLVLIAGVLPLTMMEPFAEVINARVQSLGDVGNDGSAQGRQEIYAEALPRALTSLVGSGLGSGQGFDSAVLDTLINLGWIGTIYYIGGLLLLIYKLFQSSVGNCDSFINTSRGIVTAMLLQLLFGNSLIAPSGMILWGFLGLGVAGCQYHEQQQLSEDHPSCETKL
jgi:hypothetical protein